MTQALKDEALEYVQREILFGFDDVTTILENIQDMFYDVEDFDAKWLHAVISEQFGLHQKVSQEWKQPTDFDRLRTVFDQLNKEKIVSLHKVGFTRQDAEHDCREIIDELAALGIKAKGYCYYHIQDLERAMDENILFIGYDSIDYNDEIAIDIAKRILVLLEENGFQTSWNGSVETRLKIEDINWQKAYDGIDYNYDHVFSIFTKEHTPTTKNNRKKPFWKFW